MSTPALDPQRLRRRIGHEIDPRRIAVWGLGDGAVAAGLLMDSDTRPRACIRPRVGA